MKKGGQECPPSGAATFLSPILESILVALHHFEWIIFTETSYFHNRFARGVLSPFQPRFSKVGQASSLSADAQLFAWLDRLEACPAF
jgi:hypothetical protein